MNYEFIIGTVIGLAGVVITIALGKDQIISWFKKDCDCSDLLLELTDTKLPSKKQKKALENINKKLIRAGKKGLLSKYINNFKNTGMRKEALFLDICTSNNIELTPEICNYFLKNDAPALRKQ